MSKVLSNNLEKKWILRERTDPDLLAHLLKLRGVEDGDHFLTPQFPQDLHDSFLMKGMGVAVDRLIRAIEIGEPIGVFADYDTDGTPGAALFIDGLIQLGAHVRVYIPTRTEGYGMSTQGIDALVQAGSRVVVTIDMGITGKVATDHARTLGVDVIITDHHVVQETLFPQAALAVLNPKQADCPYPFKELCGGGIVWKVLSAIVDELVVKNSSIMTGKNPEAIKRWALDFAAISTICDMVPLIGENRLLATYGLRVLAKTRRPGLRALLKMAGVDPASVTATTVGFQIGPRINAPTRLAADSYEGTDLPGPQCSLALALLLTENPVQATELAEQLHQFNLDRQLQLDIVLLEAMQRVEAEGLAKKKVILLAGADWPAGIVGLVAGRIMERYGRPTFVLGIEGGEVTGSARSVEGFHLVEALEACQVAIKKFGGHAKAAGITVELAHLELLYEQLLAYADQRLTDEQLGPRIELAAELGGEELTLETIRQIEQLAPHGIGNPRPNFLLQNLQVVHQRRVGADGKHAKLLVRLPGQETGGFSAIGFGLSEHLESIDTTQLIDAAVQLAINSWQGREEVDLHLIDVRAAEGNSHA